MRWTVPQKPELSGMSLLRETTKQRCEPPCPGRKLLSPSRKIDYVQGRPHDETGIVVRLYRDGDVIREDQGRGLQRSDISVLSSGWNTNPD